MSQSNMFVYSDGLIKICFTYPFQIS